MSAPIEVHTRQPRDQLRSLTGLRFIAAALIVLHHSQGNFGIPPEFMQPWQLDNGVSFFFVLSGFILTYVYPELRSRHDVEHFLLSRFARVWPLHVVCLVGFMFAFGGREAHGDFTNFFGYFLSNLLIVHSWIPDFRYIFSFNSVSWSISTETFFYLSFPMLLYSLGANWWWKQLAAAAVLISMIIGVDSLGLGGFRGMEPGLTVPALIYIHPLSRIFEFILGMTTCVLWKRYWPMTPPPIAGLLEGAAVTLLLWNASQIAVWARFSGSIGSLGLANWLTHSGTCLAAAILIASFASGTGLLSRFMGSKPMLLLGEISFAMYMTHQLLLNSLLVHFPRFSALPDAISFLLYLALLLFISWLSWRFIEIPAKNVIIRWGSRRIGERRLWKGSPVK